MFGLEGLIEDDSEDDEDEDIVEDADAAELDDGEPSSMCLCINFSLPTTNDGRFEINYSCMSFAWIDSARISELKTDKMLYARSCTKVQKSGVSLRYAMLVLEYNDVVLFMLCPEKVSFAMQ